MIIIWGTRLAGKTDVVPNLFYVRTQYAHVWWIPLIPIKSYVILHGSESGDGFKGVQVSMSFKSVLSGWLRTASIFVGIAGLILAVFGGSAYMEHQETEQLGRGLFGLAMFAGSILVYWMCEFYSRASRERAYQLGQELGIPQEMMDQFLDGTAGQVQDVQPADDQGSPGMPTPQQRQDDEPWRQD